MWRTRRKEKKGEMEEKSEVKGNKMRKSTDGKGET